MMEFFKRFSKNKINKADFLSLISHQFKKPLSSIKLSLEMLLKEDFGEIKGEQRDIIEKILQRTKTMVGLTDDMLIMAKIEQGESVLNLTLVDMADLIESAINVEKEEIAKKEINFDFEKPETEIPKILLDRGRIYLSILNIIDNAVKYTPNRGSIKISLNNYGKKLEFKIQDSGIGINDYERKNLFTKFFRGGEASKMEPVGSGLGLFIAKSIIEDHGGKIWFESNKDGGTTFFILMPIRS